MHDDMSESEMIIYYGERRTEKGRGPRARSLVGVTRGSFGSDIIPLQVYRLFSISHYSSIDVWTTMHGHE